MADAISKHSNYRRQLSGLGFTLVELLITMAIASVVMLAAFKAFESQSRVTNTQRAVVEQHQNARAAIQIMTKEIQNAGSDPVNFTVKAGSGFSFADVSTCTFSLDFTGGENNLYDDDKDEQVDNFETYDGKITPALGEVITYRLNNSQIERDSGTGWVTVAENIQSLVFTYLDEDNAILATPVANLSDIRKVRIALVASIADVGMGMASVSHKNNKMAQHDMRISSEVKVRNMWFDKL